MATRQQKLGVQPLTGESRRLPKPSTQGKAALSPFDIVRLTKNTDNRIVNNLYYTDVIRRHKGQEAIGMSPGFARLINKHKENRISDLLRAKSGFITDATAKANDRARQMRLYELIIREGKAGGGTLDVMELAKSLNAIAQEKSLIPDNIEYTIGRDKKFLKEKLLTRRNNQSDKALAQTLIYNIEEIKQDRVPKGLQPWLEAWKDPTSLKIEHEARNIKKIKKQLKRRGKAEIFSGSRMINDYGQYRDEAMSGTGLITNQGFRSVEYDLPPKEMFLRAEEKAGVNYRLKDKISDFKNRLKRGMTAKGASTFNKFAGGLAAAGAAAYILSRTFNIPGGDDEYNTIEGLRHGWFGETRKHTSDFGSGYQGPNNPEYKDYMEPTPVDYSGLGIGAAGLATTSFFWNKEIYSPSFKKKGRGLNWNKININKLSYMGEFPGKTSDFLGRDKATLKDLTYNVVRRSELAFAGIPKAFSVSTLMSPGVLRDSRFKVKLNETMFDPNKVKVDRGLFPDGTGFGYKDYLTKLTGKSKKELNKFASVEYRGGKLYGRTAKGTQEVILKHAGLMQRVHSPSITPSAAQYAKSYENMMGIAGVGKEHEFLFTGGQTRTQAALRTGHAYAHETVSKYLRLMDDPVKAFREAFPNLNPGITRSVEKVTRMLPSLGVGGESQLIGGLPKLFGRHALKALPVLIGVPVLFGTMDWMARQVGPKDTVMGEAGLLGLGAEGVRLGHMTYASVSEATGLTALRQSVEEKAPGMTGVKPFLGMTLTGMIAGTAIGMAGGAGKEFLAKAGPDRYRTMIKAKTLESKMPELLRGLPGMKGQYSKAVRGGKYGALVGAALALPFLLTGLGSDKTVEELDEEYIEGKEVAIKKARWWEFGKTPWEGGKTMYYREDWYNRLLSGAERKSIYEGDDISPIGKFVRDIADPYWLEKMHYKDRPYPITGSTGEGLGLFGPVYETTVGEVLKPAAYMHVDEWTGSVPAGRKGLEPSKALGGLGPEEPLTPYDIEEQIKQQYSTTYEAMGLRGFTASAIKQAITGEQEISEYTPVLQSASDIDNVRRKYWDLNLGGLLGLTEPYRRVNPKRPYTTQYINPIKNTMPDWMPGEEYYKDFKSGDPFTKVPEGEFRLPGQGYAARYKELEGINPEDYPLIHRYKILADVAQHSTQFRGARTELLKGNLTGYEQDIFDVTEEQIEEKRKVRGFRDDVYEESMIGRYAASITEIAQASPLEELTPLAPAHKLMPQSDAYRQYEQSIYGKEFKLWQRPIEDFIKPFVTTAENLIGLDSLPGQVSETRQVEKYFDQLEYVKFKKLESQARTSGDGRAANQYKMKSESTMVGADVYGNEFRLRTAMPKREKLFFEEFKDAKADERMDILDLVPETMKDLYIAQWDKELLERTQRGEIEGSEEEKAELEQEIFGRMAAVRSKREATKQALESAGGVPDDDWIGWRADVDLDDIKLKFLINNGKDYHNYDLWDDRVRSLKRKPYLEEAMDALEEANPFREDLSKKSIQEAYKEAVEAGIENPSIIIEKGLTAETVYDLEYKREDELKSHLRELGQVI